MLFLETQTIKLLTMKNIIEIARFKDASEAQVLLSVLRSEGIKCNLKNGITSQILSGYADTGGAIVEVLETDVPRTLEIMKEGGYEIYNPQTESEKRINGLISFMDKIPVIRNLSQEIKIILLLIVVALLVTIILFPFITR